MRSSRILYWFCALLLLVGCVQTVWADDFTWTPTTPYVGDIVQLTSTCDGPDIEWDWSISGWDNQFGGGFRWMDDIDYHDRPDITFLQNPTIQFTGPGTYWVVMSLWDTKPGEYHNVGGCVKQITVLDKPPITTPVTQSTTTVTPQPSTASFTANTTSGTAPLTVQFTDTSTGSVTGWQWDFTNDGTVDSTLQHPKYTYTAPGSYSVKLSVTGTGGTKSIVKPDYITVENVSVASITPDTAILTVEDVGVTVRGTGFTSGTTFTLVNATLGTIACKSGTSTRVSDTELRGDLSFANVREGLYDVVVTSPSGATRSLAKGFHVNPVPVVLIHGIKSNGTIWLPLEGALMKEGIPFWNFEYNTWFSPTSSATDLAEFIKDQRSTFRRDLYPNGYPGKIDIVCHSMGAIVSRWYMEKLSGGSGVRQWIGIAPAHGGSAAADYVGDMPRWLAVAANVLGGPALAQLSTTSDAVENLGPLSPSTKYRVIAGWNPTHSSDFGYGFFKRTLAKRQIAPGVDEYYYTHSGDMIVATAQSLQPGMDFEAFPIGGVHVNGEPAHDFDHVHIHSSPRVIAAVTGYLEDITRSSSGYVPPEDRALFDVSVLDTKLFGLVGPNPLYRALAISLADRYVSDDRRVTRVVSGDQDSTLTVLLDWDDGDLDMTLTSPNGTVYSPNSHPADSWYSKDGRTANFIIDAPEGGNWTVRLDPVRYPNHDIAYNLTSVVSQTNTSATIPTPKPGSASPIAVPGQATVPTDTNHDGTCDDINGNGRPDFADVVLYFNQMTWISGNEPVGLFDYNGNGRIDFADVVWLFNHL